MPIAITRILLATDFDSASESVLEEPHAWR